MTAGAEARSASAAAWANGATFEANGFLVLNDEPVNDERINNEAVNSLR